MDLRQIEYFVRVAELGGFTRAAVALGVAQPALSRQVRLLEVELRQHLLLRDGRGATPTEAGRVLLAHGRGILHQVQRAREELGRLRGALAGQVALGLPTSLARLLTVPLTRAIRERLPEARISIREGLSTALQESLVNGRLDIAVLYNTRASAELDVQPLHEEDLFLVQPRGRGAPRQGRPLRLQALADLPLVIPSRPNAIRMQVESDLAALGCRPTIALEIDGVPAILDLVADGAGSAVLPRHAVDSAPRPQDFVLRPIRSPALRTQIVLATSAQRPATLTQQTALALIRDTLAATVGPRATDTPARRPAGPTRNRTLGA